MKKSDAINIIRKHLFEWGTEELATEILTDLIEAGMTPGFVGVGEKDDWGYLDYECKWEEEDGK